MHTLILSCNTGEGHNSCAKAIQTEYAAHGESCEIVDALQFISKRASRFICDWHTRIYRHAPKLYRAGYRSVENRTSVFREGTTVPRAGADCHAGTASSPPPHLLRSDRLHVQSQRGGF